MQSTPSSSSADAANPLLLSDIRLTPGGRLLDDSGTFAEGNGPGLLALVGRPAPENAPVAAAFRRLFVAHVRDIVSAADPRADDISSAMAAAAPSPLARLGFRDAIPPMTGGEYLSDAFFASLYADFDAAFSAAHAASALPLDDFLRSLGPAWREVGKVSLHLAENRRDPSGARPFAFLATFIHRAGDNGEMRHLPLASALKAFASDPRRLQALLAPLEAASRSSRFLAALLSSRRIFQPCALSAAEAFSFLRDIPAFEAAGLLVRMGNLWRKKPPRAKISVSVGTASGSLSARALLDFDIALTIDGSPVSEAERKRLLSAQDGLVRIRGEWVQVDAEKLRKLLGRWQKAKDLAAQNGLSLLEGLRLLAGDPASPADASDTDCEVRPAGDFARLMQRLARPDPAAVPPLPPLLASTLRPYQREGVAFLFHATSAGLGACLADDMGLGKTLQMLALFSLWKAQGAFRDLPAIVVVPASLLRNWQDEAARFAPDLDVRILHPSALPSAAFARAQKDPAAFLRGADVALVTYGLFARIDALRSLPFPAVVADEAQAIKNPATRQSRALRSVSAPRRVALTGTPVENRLSDLWSIFDFINPGLLGSLPEFNRNLADRSDFALIRRLTRPFILRRLKTDKSIIADLPDKTEIDAWCGLSPRQAALYAKTVDELAQALEKVKDETPNGGKGIRRRGLVLAFMTRFKQICDHPALYLGTGDWSPDDSSKFLALRDRAEVIAQRQEKLLVFTQYRELVAPLADFLASVFARPGLVLHGGTPVRERAALVRRFQDPDGPPFFVLSLKAAGVGLNLTAASHVVHFDRWWNPAVENQASDRAFRIGQKRNVLVQKFIVRGTLEEKIDAMIKEKSALADALFSQGAEKLLTEMSDGELVDFVKLDMEKVREP